MKTKVIVAFALAAMVLFSGCGTQKKTTKLPSGVTSTKRENDPCVTMAQSMPYAASGTSISFDEQIARNSAAFQARIELATMMEACIEGAIKAYMKNVGIKGENFAEGSTEGVHTQFVAQSVKNSRIVNSTLYDRSDGTVQVYVCVAIDESSVFNSALENTLSRDGILGVDFDRDLFEKNIKEQLEEYKKNKYGK